MTRKPSYRFAGYIEPWEEKKLGEIVERITRKNKNLESDLPLTISAQYGLIDQETFFNKKVASKDVSGYYLLKKGEFAYNKSYSSDYPWGAVKRLDNYEMGVLSTLYIVFRPNSIDSDFLAVYYDSPKWYKEVSMRAAEGARNHGLLNISPQDFFDTELIFPVNQSEQTAIGSFFQDIDQLIGLQQRKLEVLKEQKKTYLKLLFPAKGQTKPTLRFAGFEDEWKEVKLGEIGETYTGLSGKTKEDFGHGEGKFITYVNVFNNPLTDLYGLDSVEIDDKQRRVQYGDVLFTTSSETPEDVGLSSVWMGTEDNVYLNSFCFGYRPQKGIFDLYYLAFVLRSFSVRREFMLLAQGISRFNISKTKVMDMAIHVPSLPEQEAIGSFFQDLDKAIAKQEEKVNQLKESKQTLLRKMFI